MTQCRYQQQQEATINPVLEGQWGKKVLLESRANVTQGSWYHNTPDQIVNCKGNEAANDDAKKSERKSWCLPSDPSIAHKCLLSQTQLEST